MNEQYVMKCIKQRKVYRNYAKRLKDLVNEYNLNNAIDFIRRNQIIMSGEYSARFIARSELFSEMNFKR